VFEEEELAVTWERFVYDDSNHVMRSEFTPMKTTISFFEDKGNGVIGQALTLWLSNKIREKFNIPAIDNHNLGILPVSFMPNLPQKNFLEDARWDYFLKNFENTQSLIEMLNNKEEIREMDLEKYDVPWGRARRWPW
jgi:hypothetical protein